MDEFNLDNPLYFLNRTTVLYGESKSGKTTILIHILKTLSTFCDQIVVFAPTDPQHRTYSSGLVPSPLIHYAVTPRILEEIWERQEAMSAIAKKASDPEVLRRLYSRLKMPHLDSAIAQAQKVAEDAVQKIRQQYMDDAVVDKKTKEITDKISELTTLIYKRGIAENRDILRRDSRITPDEQLALDYIGFNPNLVIIFDDCSAELGVKEIKKSKVFKKLFYQNRWANITVIICAHNDKNLEQDIRKNTFVNIFTTRACATGFFATKSNYFSAEQIAQAREAVKHLQDPGAGHQRIAFLREENKFYRLTAKIFPGFKFGSDAVWSFCEKIKDNGNTAISRENKYYGKFFPGRSLRPAA